MRYDALLDEVGDDGATRRAHLEASARRGSAFAQQQLQGPDCPDAVAYLRAWVYELHGRSGATMSGLAPLSYPTLLAWTQLRDVTILPHEVDALVRLDAVLLHPALPPEEAEAADTRRPESYAWPTRSEPSPGSVE